MTARARNPFSRLSAEAKRILIDEMALSLLLLPEFGDDAVCIQHLHVQGFRPGEILNHLDIARDIARIARAGEAELWNRLLLHEEP